jgi:anti-anti-sigma regulatory factor
MTLRIQRSLEPKSIIFTLTGRIQADQVPDLEALLSSESSDREIVLDLGHVRLVDRTSVQFLISRESAGTELRNCSPYIREWIAQEKNAMQRRKSESAADLES